MSASINELILEATKDDQWSDINALVSRCDDAGVWTDEELDLATQAFKKDYVRRHIRSMKDESGWPLFASIKQKSAEGVLRRVYKQELLFDVEDYRQVVTYHAERGRHHYEKARGYGRRGEERYGVQLPLPFAA